MIGWQCVARRVAIMRDMNMPLRTMKMTIMTMMIITVTMATMMRTTQIFRRQPRPWRNIYGVNLKMPTWQLLQPRLNGQTLQAVLIRAFQLVT
jgi:hypothetical protein